MSSRASVWLLPIVSFILAGCAWTCKSAPQEDRGIKHGSGLRIVSSADLQPYANPGPQKLNYAGTVIPVDVKITTNGGILAVELWSNEAQLETEKYKSTEQEFDLLNAAGEDYSPAIPILRFPMNIGDSWNWSGQMVTGTKPRNATATITTTDDKVDMGSPADALRVDVSISMESGAASPAMRTLSFWFVKGKGIVKREFGDSTSRQPATAAS